ncbi:MAG: leucine-rich repeat domain-containing protein [Candidatus Hydrogenedentota bacterium]
MEITTHPYLVHPFWRSDIPALRRVRQCEALRAADSSLQDENLRQLALLDGLRYLDLSETNITNPGLAHLRPHKGLEVLSLARTRAGNEGLAHVSRLSSLRELNLDHTGVSDLHLAAEDEALCEASRNRIRAAWRHLGLGHLADLVYLRRLSLRGTGVHGPGLQYLAHASSLTHLDLRGTALNAAGIRVLRQFHGLHNLDLADTATSLWPDEHGIAGLRHLESLDLSGSWLTDDELRRFAEWPGGTPLPNLVRLDLSRTRVTDHGLGYLACFPRLRDLELTGARVTAKGLDEILARPGIRVVAR